MIALLLLAILCVLWPPMLVILAIGAAGWFAFVGWACLTNRSQR